MFGSKAAMHSEDYSKPTIVSFDALPCLNAVRMGLEKELGAKAANLCAEGNHYFESKSGIGFHGDSERKIVVCLSLKAPPARFVTRGACLALRTTMAHRSTLRWSMVTFMLCLRRRQDTIGTCVVVYSRVRVVHAAGAHAFKWEAVADIDLIVDLTMLKN